MDVAKTHQDQLERIKKNVKNTYESFKPNYDRFNEFVRFTYDSSLTADDISLLDEQGKPSLEFNITEPYISRMLGEFSKQEPGIEVSAEDESLADPQMIKLVEAHLRHALFDSKNHHTRYQVYRDILSGGFSVFKVYTDYANPMSFNQVINIDRVFDPTLCGFDTTARYSHKGDGRFCFELFPYTKEDFEEKYPDVSLKNVNFNRQFAGFNWSYMNDNTETLLLVDYYEKKKKRVKIVQLPDGKSMTMEEYKKMVDEWQDFVPPPVMKGKPRWTEIEKICRYRCMLDEVLEYEETDYSHFPLIFVDGNSVMIKTPKNGNVRQFTRPYTYQAKGAQRLKNYAGICVANEIENTVQSKFIIAKEALPKEEDFLAAYKNQQRPSNMVFNAFFEQDPNQPIPNPIREVQRVPAPPELMQTFSSTDSLIQNILGSYDASLGINDNQLSGIAIVEGATQSNSAAMPYIVGYLQGLNRVAEVYVDLFPKYVTTPRSIPVMGIDGKKSYVKINQPGAPSIDYDSNILNVKVEAGVSFQIQKSRALNQMIGLMKVSPTFDQFMNQKGLPILLDNVEIRGIDQLKIMAEDWLKEMEAAKQKAQQEGQENNPDVIKNQIEMAKLQQRTQSEQAQFAKDMAKLKQDEMKVISDAVMSRDTNEVQRLKAEAEIFSKKVDMKLAWDNQRHQHMMSAIETHHKLKEARRPKGENRNASTA
jgi:hypothetical protein